MCKVYNTVGSLKTVKEHLAKKNINDFKSINELISFQDTYPIVRQQIMSNQRTLLLKEKEQLSSEILQLKNKLADDKIEIKKKLQGRQKQLQQRLDVIGSLRKNYLQEILYGLKALYLAILICYFKLFPSLIIYFSTSPKAKVLAQKCKRFDDLDLHFEETVNERSAISLSELDHKKRTIDEINTFIYGAIGEQKVVKELEQLSDEYTLINDFTFSFAKGIYARQEKQYIKSIQIDHLLISPSGIFLIETKNWSKESIKNLSLRSPVEQIKRTNYGLYKILSYKSDFKLDKHHWGERKIPIRNLIVLINHKPKEEFEHVKILTLDELLGYIEYFTPSLSIKETQDLSNFLTKINN